MNQEDIDNIKSLLILFNKNFENFEKDITILKKRIKQKENKNN